MGNRSRSHRARGDKVIDVLRWGGSHLQFGSQAAGTAALTFITDGATETLLRIRGEVLCYLDAAQAPTAQIKVAIGALVVQAGSGTTVINAPTTDPDAPWLFYETFDLAYEEMVTDVIDIPLITAVRLKVDSKAMRILRPGREVQMVVENTSIQSAASFNLGFSSRVLLGSH